MLNNAYMSYSVISIPYLNPFFTYCVFMYFYLQFTHINLTITAYRNDCPIFFANLNIYLPLSYILTFDRLTIR